MFSKMKIFIPLLIALNSSLLINGCSTNSPVESQENLSSSSALEAKDTCESSFNKLLFNTYFTKDVISDDTLYSYIYTSFGYSIRYGDALVYSDSDNKRYRNFRTYPIDSVECADELYRIISNETSTTTVTDTWYSDSGWVSGYPVETWDYGDTLWIQFIDVGKVLITGKKRSSSFWSNDTMLRNN